MTSHSQSCRSFCESALLSKNAIGIIAAMKSPILSAAMVLTLSLGSLTAAYADSATWNLNPISGDWNTAANWTPNTVPNGPNDVATFEASNQTDITLSRVPTEVNELVFNPGASAFTITAERFLTISGTGITNDSGITQNFVATISLNNIIFTNSATAGDMTFFTATSGTPFGGFIIFSGTSSAGHGTFAMEGSDSQYGGTLAFADSSSAANGSFTLTGGRVGWGYVDFLGGTAGDGVFLINGGTTSGAFGGIVLFSGGTAGNATLIANPGTNGGGGGRIKYAFTGTPDASETRIQLFGDGTLDMTYGVNGGRTVGSIEGDGVVMLGGNLLITGANNLSTVFSGTIDGGSLEKIGTGTLKLSGANTYTGGTTVSEGALAINNTTGSGTGTGAVQVSGGILAGDGTIAGAVTVGTGNGTGAFLTPAMGASKATTLTIQNTLSFKADGTYTCTLSTRKRMADQVIANGVLIESGAQFNFVPIVNKRLTPGTVFTVIDNTAAIQIAGTFSNLPDGSVFMVGRNTFQASYTGGDGNDLTLAVVQ